MQNTDVRSHCNAIGHEQKTFCRKIVLREIDRIRGQCLRQTRDDHRNHCGLAQTLPWFSSCFETV